MDYICPAHCFPVWWRAQGPETSLQTEKKSANGVFFVQRSICTYSVPLLNPGKYHLSCLQENMQWVCGGGGGWNMSRFNMMSGGNIIYVALLFLLFRWRCIVFTIWRWWRNNEGSLYLRCVHFIFLPKHSLLNVAQQTVWSSDFVVMMCRVLRSQQLLCWEFNG